MCETPAVPAPTPEAAPAAPDQEAVAAFNAAVQGHIDNNARLGVTLTWEEASIQFGNLLTNYAADPDKVNEQFSFLERIDALEARAENHENRIDYLEDVGGGTVVGPV